MTRCTWDAELNAALEEDAAKLTAQGQDPGPELEDFDFGPDPDDNSDCHNCHGEGFVAHCFEEWACMYPDEGCDLCMRRCDWCAPASKSVGSAYLKETI